MSCAHPLKIRPSFSVRGRFFSWKDYVNVPCGYCVNCRRDRQNFLIDCAEYEYCKRLTAAFVTLTYNDIYLIDRCALHNQFGFVYDYSEDGSKTIRTSLNYSDLSKFINNLRHFVKNHPELHGVLCQPDFSFMYCGEYGDIFGRCHFHILFFGLDFAFFRQYIEHLWPYGFVDVLPLLDGGIRYVTKYMDKFLKGPAAFYEYTIRGVAAPKLRTSVGFGQGLLWDNVDSIVDNFYTYPIAHGKRRPISAYWKHLLTGNCVSRDVTKSDWRTKHPVYVALRNAQLREKMRTYNLKDFRKEKMTEFSLRQARIREDNIIKQLHSQGIPVYDDFKSVVKNRFGFVTYDNKKVRKLPTCAQRLLSEEYRYYLHKKWLEDKFPYKEVS